MNALKIMGKFKQTSKILWGRMRGKSMEEIAQEMMKDPDVQKMMQRVQIGLKTGRVTQQDLTNIQQKAMANPKEAQREMDELMKKLEK